MANIETVTLILEVVAVYCATGILFALVFLTFGVGRLDAGARGAGLGFRLMVFPGVVALWPLMLARWLIGGAPQGGA